MVSGNTFKLLKFICNCNSEKLKLIAIHFKKVNPKLFIAKLLKVGILAKSFWCVTFFVSLAISVVELTSSLRVKGLDIGKLFKVLYHGFLLIIKVSTYSSICTFNKNSLQIAHLFNCLYKKDSSVCLNKSEHKKRSKPTLFAVLIFVSAVALFLFCFPLLPIVAFVLPSLHKTGFFQKFISCNTLLLRLFLFSTQVLFLLPVATFSPLFSTTCLVTLKVICESLENLRY